MSLNGGDALARGAKSAAFSTQSGISDFENDLIFRPEILAEKYGLSEQEVASYQERRNNGERLPDLPTANTDLPDSGFGFTVADRRPTYLDTRLQDSAPIEEPKSQFPEKQYSPFRPILDRLLIKRISLDKNMEVLSDGSLRDKKTKFIIPAKYRQHNNTGIVLAAGDFVVMGGVKVPMSDIVRPGDVVIFGEYNAEKTILPEEQVKELCDLIQFDYVSQEEDLNIVRVQDVRGVRRPLPAEQEATSE
jgi:co-chaperonin GroES (HSP10)